MYTNFNSQFFENAFMRNYFASLFLPRFRQLPVKGPKSDNRLKVFLSYL